VLPHLLHSYLVIIFYNYGRSLASGLLTIFTNQRENLFPLISIIRTLNQCFIYSCSAKLLVGRGSSRPLSWWGGFLPETSPSPPPSAFGRSF